MPFEKPIRIVSDLHLAHPASLVQDVRALEPLLDGARTVVFNGDTVELQMEQVRTKARESVQELRELCREIGVEALFINGNHDPTISDHDHLDLLDGRLLVTHGHAIFPEIAPWGSDAQRLRAHYQAALREIAGTREPRMEENLQAIREACLRAPPCAGQGFGSRMGWLRCILSEMAHPRRPFEVLRAWSVTPSRAAAFIATYRPDADCFIMGHTHLPGCWRRDNKLVFNTGAYFPGLGRRIIELNDGCISMRKVEFRGSVFRPGKELLRTPLTTTDSTSNDPTLPVSLGNRS